MTEIAKPGEEQIRRVVTPFREIEPTPEPEPVETPVEEPEREKVPA